jgi:glycosyltransferase involved in cell wall biosynthesis
MRFSVIIPLYNKGDYISRTLDAVTAQTFRDFEVVVVDDGSTDDGPARVRAYGDPRVRLVAQPNGGVSAARNRGAAEARGELLAFIDGDDTWEPGFLAAIDTLATRFPAAGLFATGYRAVHPGFAKSVAVRAPRDGAPMFLLERYFALESVGPPLVTSSSVAIPRAVFADIGGFAVGKIWGEDRDLWGRIALRHPVAYCRDILASWHTDARGRACNRKADDVPDPPFARSAAQAFATLDLSPQTRADVARLVNRMWLMIVAVLLANGDRARVRQVLATELLPESVPVYARVLRVAVAVLPLGLVTRLDKLTRSRIVTQLRRRTEVEERITTRA